MTGDEADQIVSLSDEQVSLGLFAEALAGVPVPFAVAEPEDVWPWSVGGTGATAVVLPPEATRRQFRSIVLHQLLLLSPTQPTVPLGVEPGLFAAFYVVVEDIRVDAVTRRFFPGAVADLDELLDSARAKDRVQADGSLLESLGHFSLGVMVSEEHQHIFGTVLAVVLTGTAAAAASAAAAEALCHLAGPANLLQDLEVIEDLVDDLGLDSEATSGVALDAEGTPSKVVQNQSLSGGHAASDALDEANVVADDATEDLPTMGLVLPHIAASDALADTVRTYLYDEWDYTTQRHRPSWCRVVEEALHGDDVDFVADVRQRHQALRAQIRTRFARLRPEQLVRVHRSLDGDDIDLDAAIEAIADRRSGAVADERLHIRRDRASRDVATAFLVDLSASTSAPAVPPEPEPLPVDGDPMDDPMSYGPIWDRPRDVEPVRRVIDVAKDAVALMCDALDELGDQHAVYGFSGTGREQVDFKIGKDFADRTSAGSWAAIAEMKPLRYTRMGPAIRHAAAKIAKQQARTRLLIIVSDGYPQDVDYGDDRTDRDYGIEDTAQAIREASDQGIETFCVTIDPAGHDYLRVMFPDRRYLVVDDVEALPEELAKLYLALASY